jgi:hypothetical protein
MEFFIGVNWPELDSEQSPLTSVRINALIYLHGEVLKLRIGTSLPLLGRAIAQAVSRWLPTAAGRIRSRVWSSRICGG